MSKKKSTESVVREIHPKTRTKFLAVKRIRFSLGEGLRGEESIALVMYSVT